MTASAMIKRVERLEQSGGGDVRFIFQSHDETREEVLEKAGVPETRPGLTVFILRWALPDDVPREPAKLSALE